MSQSEEFMGEWTDDPDVHVLRTSYTTSQTRWKQKPGLVGHVLKQSHKQGITLNLSNADNPHWFWHPNRGTITKYMQKQDTDITLLWTLLG